MQTPISHIAWRRLPAELRAGILRQVSRNTAIGSTPDQLPIDDNLRAQLIDALIDHEFRPRRPTDTHNVTRNSGNKTALEWWASLTSAERGKYINFMYTDVVQSS